MVYKHAARSTRCSPRSSLSPPSPPGVVTTTRHRRRPLRRRPTAAAATSAAFPATVEHALGTTVVEGRAAAGRDGRGDRAGQRARRSASPRSASRTGTATSRSRPGRGPRTSSATPSPTVLSTSDGLDYEGIAALDPDLIIGTNAGLDEESYGTADGDRPDDRPPEGRAALLLAVGRPVPPDRRRPSARTPRRRRSSTTSTPSSRRPPPAHPEFAGQDGDLPAERVLRRCGDRVPGGSEHRVPHRPRLRRSRPSSTTFAHRGARRSSRSSSWACSTPPTCWCGRPRRPATAPPSSRSRCTHTLEAVKDGRLVFTDGVTAGAIYFTSPLSLPFVLEHLVPALAETSPATGRPRSSAT